MGPCQETTICILVVYSVFLFRFKLLHGVGDRNVLCLSDLGVLKIE